VADHSRIEELRRRVQRDPASIAFAQLAEEYRRAGRYADAVEACRAGLVHHPEYLSALVTLGRALIETGDLAAAHDALAKVFASAPDNLTAIKGLAEIHSRQGEREEALALYNRALALVPKDPELGHLVAGLTEELAERRPEPTQAPAAPFQPVVEPQAVPETAPEPLVLVGAEASNGPGDLLDSQPLERALPGTPEQVAALERWLDAILADREARQ
jgi:tetratricopeptide (TPR) repeat protein